MKKLTILALLAALVSSCRSDVDPVLGTYLKDSLSVVTERCQNVLDAAYMAGTLLEERTDIPGWEGFPVKHYEYYTGVDVKINVPKKGEVYMLNPSAEKLAKWIINAVWDVKGTLNYEDIEKVRTFIKWQSGGQFPVRGAVYEAMYTPDFYEPYIFKDGVTVYVADSLMFPADKHCTQEQLDFYLNLTNADLKPNTGRYARICSTTREMYYANGGTVAVGTGNDGERSQAWLDVVRDLYQKAWNSDKNELITAWAKSNL
ncbi:MAG: cellulase [Bacteroidales bacterium]|nr:cellulase [Bacteroidales bacterium]MDD4671200.1 cellulase [Bacteroidales bacterium]